MNSAKLVGFVMAATMSAQAVALPRDEAANSDRQQLKTALITAQNDVTEIKRFLRDYGVELVREQISELHGEINGKLDGELNGIMLGNIARLFAGISGLGSNLTTLPLTGAPSMPLGTALSNVLGGMQGFGGMRGKISGVISGKIDGAGYQINREASSYYISALDRRSLKGAMALISSVRKSGFSRSAESDLIESIYKNPYYPTPAQVEKFQSVSRDLVAQLDLIDRLVATNVGSDDPVFDQVYRMAEGIKRWAETKRVTIAIARPEPGLVLMSDFVLNQERFKKYGCNYKTTGEKAIPASIDAVPLTTWREKVRSATQEAVLYEDFLCGGLFSGTRLSIYAAYKATKTYAGPVTLDGQKSFKEFLFQPKFLQIQEHTRLIGP